jgi:LDH2 family malate/lactate/ureidoglycolate dehydrogenase
MAFASAPFKTTAPYGSTEALFCTNPLAFGFPTQGDSIVFDMTTSSMAYYGLIQAKTAGKKVPADIGYDKTGKPTQDPAEIMAGALKTMAGHKGSGLALVGQILASSFVKADYFDNDSDNAGNLVIAINPGIFSNKKDFVKDVTKMTSRIKKAKKLKGVEEIMLPGERGNKLAKSRLKAGIIEIEDNLYKELQKVTE